MRFGLNDARIKERITRYRETGQERFWKDILDMVSPLIYNYPFKVRMHNEDDCSEFYCYILERLSSIISGYRITAARFTTWLFIVLRRRYYNWLKSRSWSGRPTAYWLPMPQKAKPLPGSRQIW